MNLDPIIEAAFEALQEETGYGMSDDNAREFSRIILAAAAPLIRAAALEEAAQVAELVDIEYASIIAAHIRALKKQP